MKHRAENENSNEELKSIIEKSELVKSGLKKILSNMEKQVKNEQKNKNYEK
jgi:hypothetical protein